MIIQHNLSSINSNRQYRINTTKSRKTTERLSSGYRINRSADDAAGLMISEKMRWQIRGLNRAADNIRDGISYIQVAEGALNEVQGMMQRMNELAVQAANDTNTQADRDALDAELQQLKEEVKRVFSTTTFNTQKIWDRAGNSTSQNASSSISFKNSMEKSIDVTNANCGVLALDNYTLYANDDGIHVEWMGYDGNSYKTEKIDWAVLEANGYRFEMSDYFGIDNGSNKLYSGGNPVFEYEIALDVGNSVTRDEIIDQINGIEIESETYANLSVRFEDSSGNEVAPNRMEGTVNTNLEYKAVYASNANGTGGGFDFDLESDTFSEPVSNAGGSNLFSNPLNGYSNPPTAQDIADARNSTQKWSYEFQMAGLGKVIATSSKVEYYSRSTADVGEGIWWDLIVDDPDYGTYEKAIIRESNQYGGGTLGDVMNALTGDANSGTPGLLDTSGGGIGTGTGQIKITFDVEAENAFIYGNGKQSKDVGSFSIVFTVFNTDTESDVLGIVSGLFNNNQSLDMYKSYSGAFGGNNDTSIFHVPDVKGTGGVGNNRGDTCSLMIQSGASANTGIEILYKKLSQDVLGIKDINVKTHKDASEAIYLIQKGLEIVSEQRSLFGAYQNRLEYAGAIDNYAAENTQAAESRIRDADITEEVLAMSKQRILMQVGESMLAQGNQNKEHVLRLLQ